MNAVEVFLLAKTAGQVERKAKEIQDWHLWKKTGDPAHLEPLLKAYTPVIEQKVRLRKPPAIPPAAFRAELQTQFIRALDKYDPNRGAALNTHVEIHLKKALRYSNQHANLAYIPEGQSSQIGKLNRAHDELTELLGQVPTNHELAEHVGLPVARVERIQKARMRDIPASGFESDPSVFASNFEDQQIAVAKNELHKIFPKDLAMHSVFNHTFGTNGHEQVLSTSALARRMGKSVSQTSRMKTRLGNTLRDRMGLNKIQE